MSDEILTVTIAKRAGETIDRTFDLRGEITRAWRGGVEYGTAEYVRPVSANGYDYECTTAGRTGAREPRWPTTVAGTVADGSVVWTCRAPNSGSADALSGNASVSAPTGITATHQATESTGDITIRFAGGTAGQTYSVLVTVNTSGGQVLQFEVIVQVRS